MANPPFDTPCAGEYLKLLQRRLPHKTLRHSLSVAAFMLTFHEEAGINREQAIAAGLLHDLCKPMDPDELMAEVEARGITLTEGQLDTPAILHGPVAAAECEAELGITDPDVLDAIFWHTTGRPDWNAVGLSLYVADFAEPHRTLDQAAKAREVLREDGFRAAVLYAAKTKLEYVARRFTVDATSKAFGDWVAGDWVE